MNTGESDNSQRQTAEATAIDVHNHAMPLPLLEWLQREGLADLSRFRAGIVLLDPVVSGVGKNTPLPWPAPSTTPRSDSPKWTMPACRLMPCPCRRSCSAPTPRTQGWSPLSSGGADELAGYVADGGNRLYGLGSIPLGFPDAADEARRCLDELGFPGVAIGTRGGGKELDDPVNDDLWALLAERNAFIFVHPSGVPTRTGNATSISPARRLPDRDGDQHRSDDLRPGLRTLRPDDVSGPRRGLPAVATWPTRSRMARKDVAHTTEIPPSEFCKQLYYDTAVFDSTLLAHLVSDMGVDRVLLGTDHPLSLATPTLSGQCGPSASVPPTLRRFCGGPLIRCSGLRCQLRPRWVRPSIGSSRRAAHITVDNDWRPLRSGLVVRARPV